MSPRIPREWVVVESLENPEADRCLDLFQRPDGSFGFEAFRRDVEDRGVWTPVSYFSGGRYQSREAAIAAARLVVGWMAPSAKA